MKRLLSVIALFLTLTSAPVLHAHHAAEGIVDEDVWLMIDEMIADTPHADMVLSVDSDTGMWEMDITSPSTRSLEMVIDDGLLTFVGMLDTTSITIEYNDDGSVAMVVTGG